MTFTGEESSSAKTILITGASSGIGRQAAKLFQQRGWNVVATMRKVSEGQELGKLEHTLVVPLDVTDSSSIEAAVSKGIERFGGIDAVLNNAGFGAYGPLEATSLEKIRLQFDTNVIGLFAVTKALLSHFRSRRSGLIINVSSIGGKIGFPFGSLYHGSKFAVEGLSEALSFETEAIGVRVKLIEPGMVKTSFNQAVSFSNDTSMTEYQDLLGKTMKGFENAAAGASEPEAIAETIFRAATDGSKQLRYPAGEDAEFLMKKREEEDDQTFLSGIHKQFGLSEVQAS